jgi:hypothetical protein
MRIKPLHFRASTLVGAFVLAVTSAYGMDLGGYSVVKLHGGLNNLPLAVAGHRIAVVIGHRENFNAHSFNVVTFYLSNGDPSVGLDIVGVWDRDREELTENVVGGADCLLHDFRLLSSNLGAAPMLIVADRPLLTSYVDNAAVSVKFYALKQKTDGLPGGPAYWFDLVETETSKAAYCDVGVALSREFGLGDYRTSPRPDGYRNSPDAISSRGP